MNFLLLLIGLGVLSLGAEFLVRGASGLAVKAGIPKMVVGLTVVSIGTSLPELLVSLKAAYMGIPDIAVGNIVGSNIVNISLILGITALIFPLSVNRLTLTQEWPIMMSASLLLFILGMDGMLTPAEGWIMLGLFGLFTLYLFVRTIRTEPEKSHLNEKPNRFSHSGWLFVFVVVGIIGLKYGADWFLEGAIGIARFAGLSEHIIGVTIVAFGTSVPELMASVVAAYRKEAEISLGNLIGSNIFNILGILGISSVLVPLEMSDNIMNFDIYWMLAVALLLFGVMAFGKRISRWGGALSVLAYIIYVGWLLQL